MSRAVSEDLLAGRYRLDEPIGFGGMAEVHRGWDTLLRRHVAIKLFQPGFDPSAVRRFDNEVRALARLCHPGLVAVYDADTEGSTPFVVLQLIEGGTLHERIADGPLPLEEVCRLGAGLADALAHVHAHGLVHRDVKPSNILLDEEGTPHLADFGLAHLTGATRLTRTDHLVGTAAYLAPEQVLGGEVDHPADVYALGLVLLECLTAQREYRGSEVEAAIARLHRAPAIPEHLPAFARRLLARMTSTEPQDRPTAPECARILSAVATPAALDSAPPLSTPPLSTPPAGTSPPAGPAPRSTSPVGAAVTDTAHFDMRAATKHGLRPSWKGLVTATGVMIGAIVITMGATSGREPATSAPDPTAPPAAEAPLPSSPKVSVDGPQVTVAWQAPGPRQGPAAPQAPLGTTSAPTPEAAVPSSPGTTLTTPPPTTTTTPPPTTSSAPPPSSETSESSPAPGTSTPPAEDEEAAE